MTDYELQKRAGKLWPHILQRLAEKDAVIATLQPGYVAPAPPTIEDRLKEAIAKALTPEELADNQATVLSVMEDVTEEAAETVVARRKAFEGMMKESPGDVRPVGGVEEEPIQP